MIDIHTEALITLKAAARLRPPGRNNRPTHVSTLYRWVRCGVGGVRLEAVRLGGAFVTSREALQRFADRLTSAAVGRSMHFPLAHGKQAGLVTDEQTASELARLGL